MITSEYNGHPVHLIEEVSEFDFIRSLLNEKVVIGCDTETQGLDFYEHSVVGVCISCGRTYAKQDYHGFYLPIRHTSYNKNLPIKEVIELIQYLVDNFKTVWWNRNFDATMLEKDGFKMPFVGKTHDAQCMAHLVMGESFPALKSYAEQYLKYQVIEFSSNNAKDHNFGTTDPTVSFVYAGQDPIVTALLSRKLWAEYPYIRKIYPIDNKVAEAIRKFTLTTELFLDKQIIQDEFDKNAQEMESVRRQIFAIAGYTFKLNSNRDKADALSRFVTLTQKTAKGAFAVNDEALEKIDHPLAKLMRRYAELEKYRGSYLAKMLEFPNPFHVNYQHCNVSCLTESNIVRCIDGFKSIKDVIQGDWILTENGFRMVEGTASFDDKIIKIGLENGAFIEGNAKHPVLVNEQWKGLGELEFGDRVTMCRTTTLSENNYTLPEIEWEPRCRKKFEFSKELDNDMAYLLGFIDGDGSLTDGVKLCFSAHEPELENHVVNLFSKRFNMTIPTRSMGTDNTVQYRFCSKSLVSWMKKLGIKAHGTEKGVDVSQWGSEQQFSYVAALFDTDGSVNISGKSFNVRLGMTSRDAVSNVAQILRFHGIDVKEFTSFNRKQPLYSLRIRTQESIERFIEFIVPKMHCSHKVARVLELKGKEVKNHWKLKQSSSRVVSIEHKGTQKVYDITVNETSVFIANGIVTHNTGRLSSGSSKGNSYFVNYNIQNVPKVELFKYVHRDEQLGYICNDVKEGAIGRIKTKGGLRDAFVCPEGYVWLSADYSAEELRVMANLSGEQNLIQPILSGEDIHKYVGSKMFGHYDPTHRTIAKMINFAAAYGAGGYTIGQKLGVSEEEGTRLLNKYNETLPQLTRWKESMIKEARRKGMVFTYFGRPRALFQYYQMSDKSKHAFADRTAVNSPVQGFGGDLIRIDLIQLWMKFITDKEFAENCKFANTVHDEINLFVRPHYLKKAYDVLLGIMTFHPSNFAVPITASPSVGSSWGTQLECEGISDDNKIILDESTLYPLD